MASAIVVGAGGISGAWFNPLKKEGVDIAAVVDLNKENAEKRIEQFELDSEAMTDLGEALAKHDSDFVVDLTVPEVHCQITCQSLEAGRHVIGEKPMSATIEQAKQMVAAADKAGKIYMVSQSRRYIGQHDRIARAIRTGMIGDVTSIHCHFFLGAHFGGFRQVMPHVLLNDMSIHHFDLARMFSGVDPVSVYAEEYNPAESTFEHHANANALFTMTNDVRFTYMGSWTCDGLDTSWHGDWRIIGTKGTLTYVGDGEPKAQSFTEADNKRRECHDLDLGEKPEVTGGQHGALKEFLAAIDGGPTPQGECHDNIKSMAMVSAAIDSADTGQRVDIEKMLS